MLLLDRGHVATALGQVIKNYQLASCDGLSFPFLVTWLFGDFTNLIGCILTDQLPFQTYLATYFCLVDITLVGQFFYYTSKSGQPQTAIKPGSPRASIAPLRHAASMPSASPHPQPSALHRPGSGRGRKRAQIVVPQGYGGQITDSPVFAAPPDSVEALYAAALDVARAAERVSLRRSNSGRPRTRHAATAPSGHEDGMLDSFHSELSLHSASTDDDLHAHERMTQSTGSLLHRGRSLTRVRTPHSGTATPIHEGEDRIEELPESGIVEIRRNSRRSHSRSQSAARARGTGKRAATVAFMSLGLLFWRTGPGNPVRSAVPVGTGHVIVQEAVPMAQVPVASAAFPLNIHPPPFPFPESTAAQLLMFEGRGNHTQPGEGRPPRPKKPIDWQEAIGRISAWCCTTLYLSSRLPQIWKNFQRKSVEGLSILLFLFAFLGNTLYVASILLMPVAPAEYTHYLLRSLPYLLGSGGTLLFDLTIMLQAWLYGSSPPLPPGHRPLDGSRVRRALSYGAIPRRRTTRHAEDGHGERRPLLAGSPMRSATEPLRPGSSRMNSLDMGSPATASGFPSAGASATASAAASAGNSGVAEMTGVDHGEVSGLGVKLFGDTK